MEKMEEFRLKKTKREICPTDKSLFFCIISKNFLSFNSSLGHFDTYMVISNFEYFRK